MKENEPTYFDILVLLHCCNVKHQSELVLGWGLSVHLDQFGEKRELWKYAKYLWS